MTDNLVNEAKMEEKKEQIGQTVTSSENKEVSAQEQTERAQETNVQENTQTNVSGAADMKKVSESTVGTGAGMSKGETSVGQISATEAVAGEDTKGSADENTGKQPSNEVDFGMMLMEYEREQSAFSRGKVVSGRVVGFTEKAMMVDFGHKSEGIVDISEVTGPNGELKLKEGDEIEVVVRHIDSSDNPPILSYIDALRRRAWSEIISAHRKKRPIRCKVVERVKGGLKVDIKGVEAFLPASLVDSYPTDINRFVGQDIEVKIVKCNRKKNNVVVSRKAITDEIIKKQKDALFKQIGEGYVVEGTVKSVLDYGAFVDIGGIDGLLHVTEMAWERVKHPSHLFNVGDKIQVKIININRKKEKVSLSYKQLLPDPWDIVPEKYPVGSVAKGKIVSIVDYGVFVELEPGVEGLVHVSEMTWSKHPKHPKKMVVIGQEVEVKVVEVDPTKRRLSLSMKSLMPNPWDFVEEKYKIGATVSGVVRSLTSSGAFVEVEDGVDGFVHISEITWKKIKHPKEVLKKKQKVEAKVFKIDRYKKRLLLSIKALQPSPWDLFVQNHRPGDIVRGKISRFTSFGVFVRLAEDLEGLCHISELSEEKVDSPDKVVKIGDELDFKILRIEPDTQKIGLSHRAVTSKIEEKESERKVYIGTEAKGALTSLGELLITKLGSGAKNLIPVAEQKEETGSTEENSGKDGEKQVQAKIQPSEEQKLEEVEEQGSEREVSTEEVREEKTEAEKAEEVVLEQEKTKEKAKITVSSEDAESKEENKVVKERDESVEEQKALQEEKQEFEMKAEGNIQQAEQSREGVQQAEQSGQEGQETEQAEESKQAEKNDRQENKQAEGNKQAKGDKQKQEENIEQTHAEQPNVSEQETS
jgi:small subunit ribosomal protein S1